MAGGWLDTLAAIAPTVATAIGGPMAGMAVHMAAKALGVEPDQEAIAGALAGGDPETLVRLKQVELDFSAKLEELGVERERIAAGDRDSARRREVEVGDWTPRILAVLLTAGFFGLLFWLTGHEPPAGSRDILNIALGSLGTGWMTAMAYYFGSSAGQDQAALKQRGGGK